MWATLSFRIPESVRRIGSFDVRVRPEGGEWDQAFTYDRKQELLPVMATVNAEDLLTLKELVETGKLKPAIDHRYTLEQAVQALTELEKGHARGKSVVLLS